MAGAESSPLIASRADLVHALARGGKPKSEWRVGTEHEKHVYRKDPLRPVPYEGSDGIGALLAGIKARTGWEYFYDRDTPIGLRNLGPVGGISLEPGGQFELSGAPQETIHGAAAELDAHLADCHAVGQGLNIHFLGLGVTPLWSVSELKRMPKSRYGIMTPYMDKVGTLGTSMMYRSATVQANLDFADEADMVKKLRVSLALQPVVTALFANSPFVDGKPSGYLSFRSHIWLDTDTARTGVLPFVFEPGFGFDRYVEHALDVPMYFVIRDGRYVDVAGESFRAFLRGELPQLPGEKPTVKDWEDHLSTLFPEVRLKQFLEMRGADMGDRDHVLALPALWVGLLYDEDALDEAADRIRDWTGEEVWTLRRAVPRTAIHTPFQGCLVSDIARDVLALAQAGLKRRGLGEEQYLACLEQTLALNKTPAERWLDKYHGEWGGDVTRIFDEAEI
ncbi:MAG: glutamate--cysteine ligase [Devosia sp. 67-54]|uniref:glutamate--cysteine ligase n=1 Tax=unclassified Devosia TaxID=196773 RepID=UPI0009622CBA|nr:MULTISPECIES: glutamate--cysteine ligase [unclassified Devosia]MBN9305328.1 glutamate--cysteine ligase [Devosia sp.]OJX18930.1 MAG: glutamate--cysteine ligase [Devosia sp. 67-54]